MASSRASIKKKHGLVEQMESRMMREIRSASTISRLTLSKRMSISPSTSGIYVDRLIEDGYLIEEEAAAENGKRGRGRPEVFLRPSPKGGFFIGVEFEAGAIHVVCLDFAENLVGSAKQKLQSPIDTDTLLRKLEQTIEKVLPKSRARIHGIGVGVPGLVDAVRGIAVDYHHIEGWKNVPIAQKLNARFRVPVYLDNNARIAALAHRRRQKNIAHDNFVCLMVRSGIGAGIVIDGKRWQGNSSIAGEIGRISNSSLSAASGSLSSGVEESASVRGILQYARTHLDEYPASLLQDHRRGLSIEHVIHAVNEGDPLAREAVLRSARQIAWLCHMISLVVDPATIVIAGPLTQLGDWLLKEIRADMQYYQTVPASLLPRLCLSTLEEDAGAYGAASLVVDAWKPNRRRSASAATRD